VQALTCGPATIALTFVLARRLFGPRIAIAAAWLVAVYPLAWQFEVRLYSESISTPLTLAILILFLERTPSWRRAAGVGALVGVMLLVRPSSAFLLAGIGLTWWLLAGLKRGAALTALTVGVAALVVVPWTIRNEVVLHGFLPISVQDAAAYGTFNATSANDPVWPYAWRPVPPEYADMLSPRHRYTELQLRSMAQRRADAYISAHPLSVVEAFFWNGITRLWDIRRPARPLAEVRPEGRSHLLALIGLVMYYLLAPLALVSTVRMWRRRRTLAWPLAATAVAASVVFTIDSGTRYRAPLEPVIVILACAAALSVRRRGGAAEH
jgi:4-amino-4-deoxy-L-arabinose transferase-like glycosyltransferase